MQLKEKSIIRRFTAATNDAPGLDGLKSMRFVIDHHGDLKKNRFDFEIKLNVVNQNC